MEIDMKKWECKVCGYIHTGDEPPETCPVCGADKSQFIEVLEKEIEPPQTSAPPQEKTARAEPPPLLSYESMTDLMVKHHVHPIVVHFPNGVVPVAATFIFLAAMFSITGLELASFYNMIFVLLTLPMVLFSGFNEWKKKYKSSMTSLFKIKIISAFIVVACAVIIVIWRMASPEILQTPSTGRTGFFLLHLVMLAATGIAGHIGGKLVFKD